MNLHVRKKLKRMNAIPDSKEDQVCDEEERLREELVVSKRVRAYFFKLFSILCLQLSYITRAHLVEISISFYSFRYLLCFDFNSWNFNFLQNVAEC